MRTHRIDGIVGILYGLGFGFILGVLLMDTCLKGYANEDDDEDWGEDEDQEDQLDKEPAPVGPYIDAAALGAP
jgi:hypothetical protein